MASLLILKGTEPGKRMPIQDDRVILGRNRECHVVIDFPAVSREHAEIVRVDGKFYIQDRDSRNGTFVNNQQIAGRTQLHDNDRIKICDFLCTFHEGAAPKPLPAELRREEPEEEDHSSSVIEASLTRMASSTLLQSQPADKLKALLEISGHLGKTLELDALLPQIADSLFQLYRQADRCFLILKDETGSKLVPKMIKTRRPGTEASARFSKSIVQKCLESGEALLSEDASADSRFAMSQSIADFRIRSVMCGPLFNAEGKAFGVIQLDTQDRTKKFTQDDLRLLMGVAYQAATALENVQMHQSLLARERFQRDMELAKQVQRGFLPRSLPQIAGYQFFAHYESALDVGGDYYDFIPLAGGRLAVLLGDVAGKGVPAALLMAKLSAEARFCMLTEKDPAAAVGRINQLLIEAGFGDRFVTLAAAFLDPAKHQVTLVNAGHLPPFLFRPAAGTVDDAMPSDLSGLPLGVLEGNTYNSHKIDLKPGDNLLLFTDGITDALNVDNVAFGMKGLRAAILAIKPTGAEPLQPADVGAKIVQAVKRHAEGRSQYDDIAMVCFGRVK